MGNRGLCPLHASVRDERWSDVLRLIEEGEDVNCRGCRYGRPKKELPNPLHIAVGKRNVPEEVVSKLITLRNINMVDSGGVSALHIAIRAERWDLVLLLEQGGG